MIDHCFMLTKNWSLEIIMFKKTFPCVFDIQINLNTKHDVPFAHGFQAHLVVAGYTIIDFAIFNDELHMKA